MHRFETFAAAFAKFLGEGDPAEWDPSEPTFVEIAT